MIIEKSESTKIDLTLIPKELMPMAQEAQTFLEIRNLYHAAIKEISTKLEILDDEFQVKHDYNPIHHMESRVKSIQSTFEKVIKKGYDVNTEGIKKITDIAGIRVICKYIDDIYHIANLLIKQDDIELIREKDYIKNPKESGYRSLHLVILVPVFLSDRVEKVPVEIQIRTIVMDTWASLEHELKYKSEGEISEASALHLQQCAHNMWEIDALMEKIHKE
ncbi:MAG: GTP pyrophosphokinase family protein [Anaerovoracaceae bacterium]